MVIQVDKQTGTVLNVTPDKNGFYFISDKVKISIKDHAKILELTKLEISNYYISQQSKP